MKSLKDCITESVQVVNEKKESVYDICMGKANSGMSEEVAEYLESCVDKLEKIRPAQVKKALGNDVNVKACKNVIEGYTSEICGIASIIEDDAEEPEEIIEYLNDLFPISNRLENLVNNNDIVELGEDEEEVLNDVTEYWDDICKVVLGCEWGVAE